MDASQIRRQYPRFCSEEIKSRWGIKGARTLGDYVLMHNGKVLAIIEVKSPTDNLGLLAAHRNGGFKNLRNFDEGCRVEYYSRILKPHVWGQSFSNKGVLFLVLTNGMEFLLWDTILPQNQVPAYDSLVQHVDEESPIDLLEKKKLLGREEIPA